MKSSGKIFMEKMDHLKLKLYTLLFFLLSSGITRGIFPVLIRMINPEPSESFESADVCDPADLCECLFVDLLVSNGFYRFFGI
jgi:hypothetical protein